MTYQKRPRGKESTEVRKSQIKGKESENSYQELKRSQKGQAHTITCVFVTYQKVILKLKFHQNLIFIVVCEIGFFRDHFCRV